MLFAITFAAFSILMVYAAYSDLRSYRLPNFISIVLVLGFAVLVSVIRPPISVLGWHLAIAGVVFVIGYILFAYGLFGGGDVKVISALALWFGPANFGPFFISMAILGGIIALLLILLRRADLPESWRRSATIRGLHDSQNGIPYGAAIAPAALWEFPKTALFAAL